MQMITFKERGYKKRTYFDIHAIILFFVMCGTMNLSFTWPIPVSVFLFLGIISTLICFSQSKDLRNTPANVGLCVFLGFFCIYLTLIAPQFLIAALKYFSLWICSCFIIMLTLEKKQKLLSIFTSGTAIIIAISFPAWILFLMKVPLPHGETFIHTNGFHIFTNYYFFLLNGYPDAQLVPRFTSMFLEPGQLAIPCVFLIFANNCNFRNRKVFLLFLAVVFSLSLIGYGILVGGLILHSFWMSKRYRLLKGFSLLAFLTIVTVISIQFSNENNPINVRIISRLELDEEKGIVGNNRTTVLFDYKFEQMMKTNDKYWGIAKSIDKDNDWTTNTSGVKKYIVMHGLVGLFFLWAFLIILLIKNRSVSSTLFFIIVIVGFVPRSMLLSLYWLFICLTAIPVLAWQSRLSSKKIV